MGVQRLVGPGVLLLASLGFTAALLEAGLRLVYPPPLHFRYPQESYDFDPEIARALRPRQHAWTHDQPVAVNSRGLRDAEYAAQPAPGVRRVLALGDSQTFGNGIALANTWPKQLEAVLGREPGSPARWEVLNAGIPGTDTWQHEVLLSRLVAGYAPHAVVLGFYVNDVSPRWQPDPAAGRAQSNSLGKRLGYLGKRSVLASLVHQRLQLLHQDSESERGRDFERYVLTGEPSPEVESGWAQVERSLAAMKSLCDAHGAAFLLAVLPRRDQVSGAEGARAYNERLAAIAPRLGIPLVDLLPDLADAYARDGQALFLAWDGHNSPLANRVVAERLAARLEGLFARVAAR
jgi:lysophospholipase L1-like esterase